MAGIEKSMFEARITTIHVMQGVRVEVIRIIVLFAPVPFCRQSDSLLLGVSFAL